MSVRGTSQEERGLGGNRVGNRGTGALDASSSMAAPPSPPLKKPYEETPIHSVEIHCPRDSPNIIVDEAHEIDVIVELAGKGAKYEIVGHASTEGTQKHNQTLSDQRTAVAEKAIKALDSTAFCTCVGMGERQPKVKERTESDRRRNRRVEITAYRRRTPLLDRANDILEEWKRALDRLTRCRDGYLEQAQKITKDASGGAVYLEPYEHGKYCGETTERLGPRIKALEEAIKKGSKAIKEFFNHPLGRLGPTHKELWDELKREADEGARNAKTKEETEFWNAVQSEIKFVLEEDRSSDEKQSAQPPRAP